MRLNFLHHAFRFVIIIFSIWRVAFCVTQPVWDFKGSRVSITMPPFVDDYEYLNQARLIAVSEGNKPAILVTAIDSVVYSATDFPNIQKEFTDEDKNTVVSLGEPGKMRGLSVIPLIIKTARYDKDNDKIIHYHRVELKVNGLTKYRPLNVSSSFNLIYRNTILNYECSELSTPEGYLIIVSDEFYNNILSLARWKEQKGWYVTVKKLSEFGGNNPAVIKDSIANAYRTWQITPEYVLLVGSKPKIEPFISSFAGFTVTDYPFSCVDGNDNFADLMVGRFPAATAGELDVMVAKTIGYEKTQTPYLADTLWYRKALMVATTYQEGGGRVVTALATKRWVREKLIDYGFLTADTVFHDLPPYPNAPETIRVLVNAGVSFINGRGWGDYRGWHYPQFYIGDVAGLSNGWKLPVVTSIYCGTGNFNANPCFGAMWLSTGSPTNPNGGVAFFGAAWTSTSTRFNNCIDYGIYQGILSEGITNCAPAMYRGKLELMKNFPLAIDSSYLRAHIETYNLLGDPSLSMWTAVPKPISVEYPATIPIGGNYFTVRVTDYNGQPLSGALVSLLKSNEVKKTGYTDASGLISLAIRPTTQDTMFITVTKHNRIPYCGNIMVSSPGLYVGYYDHNINNLGPGLIASLDVSLKNYGTSQTAFSTQAKLRSSDHLVYITDSIKNYGDIEPGATASASPFQFFVVESCPNNHEINFDLVIQSGDSIWHSGIDISVPAPTLKVIRHQIIDGGNGLLDPGESADLTVWLRNRGDLTIQNTQGILRTLTNAAIILDSIGQFGTINPGDSAVNNSDHFRLYAQSSCAIGRGIPLQLFITGNGVQEIVNFSLYIGQVTTTAPLGPDFYGYFAYDNTDIDCPEHPDYSWIEIDPNFGGSGTRVQLSNDDVKLVQLPFVFRYYGRNYNRISICSNGYLAMDSVWLADPYNWHIPSTMGPPGLVAVFWDDFRPDTLNASGVYYFNDATNHRFIVEWSRIHHVHGFLTPIIAELQTFQAILFDPAYYSTQTGDGEILFQYYEVVNDDSTFLYPPTAHNFATTGIKNHAHNDGVEYTFANYYPPAAAPLDSGRAIKFTTDPPDSFIGINENLKLKIQNSKLECLPNPFLKKVEFKISGLGFNELKIYDPIGRLIKSLNCLKQSSGQTSSLWDGTDQSGRQVSPGLYFVLCKTEGQNPEKQILKIIKLN